MKKCAREVSLNIIYLCDKVLYDPTEHIYYNQSSIIGLIEISGKSKTGNHLIYLILNIEFIFL